MEEINRNQIDFRDVILGMLQRQTPEIRGASRVWMLDDSKLWYLSDRGAWALLSVDSSQDYRRGMHDAEQNLINRNMETILSTIERES